MAPPAAPLLILVSNDRAGLAARLPLVHAARAAGYRVEAVGPPGPPIAGLVTHDWPLDRRGLNPWRELRSLQALGRVLRGLRPDLVHCFTIKAMAFGGLAARRHGLRAVHTVTGLGYVFIDGGPGRAVLRAAVARLLRRALREARAVVFQNEDDLATYLRRGIVRASQAAVIPGSGIDLGRFTPTPVDQDPPVVAFIGRLLVDKGIREFVDAARLLRQRAVPCRMVLLGSPDPGNRASVAQADVDAWVREGVVEHWGWVAMDEALPRVSVACLPSYREGLPRALVEAAAAGRPVVTTDAPGCRDTVAPGRSGLLVPPRDAEALAQALARLAQDRSLRQAMGAAGREHAARFGVDEVNRRVLATYAAALADGAVK